MYKLLLVTGDQKVCDAFDQVDWEALGFKKPRTVSTAKDALIHLKAYHTDAVALSLPAEEDAALYEQLITLAPDMPVMDAPDCSGDVENCARELGNLLIRMNADISNDGFTVHDQLMVCRREFFRALMDRRIPNAQVMKRYLRLVRSKMDPDIPCLIIELKNTGRDWPYGDAHLEQALRNIYGFGEEFPGMHILSCVLPGERIWLLACPRIGGELLDEGMSMTGLITHHVQDCNEHIRIFKGLELSIAAIRVLPALTALVAQRMDEGSMRSLT